EANGKPVAQVAVTFSVTPGNGTITGASQTTNASGVETVGSWTLSPTAGENTLTATSGSLSGSPVTFTATGTAGAAATIAANSATTQSATAGTAVSTPPSVIVKDANGNPVTGVAVTFSPAAGSGTVTPTTPVSTGSDGIAALTSWTLSPTAGSNTLTAASGTLSGSPVTFTATGTAGAATKLALTTAPSNSAQSGVAFTQQPVVQLQDVNGNAVSETGTGVTAVVATGPAGATLANATATTGGTGAASFSGLAISGPVGSYTLRFESGTLTAATSETIALSAAATTTTIITHTPDPSTVGQAIRVTFSVTSNTGTPTGNVTVTDGTDSCVGTVAAGTCDLTLSDGTLSCTGTVAAGSCSVTPLTPGPETFVATYAGDANFLGSTSAPVTHTVNLAPGPTSSR